MGLSPFLSQHPPSSTSSHIATKSDSNDPGFLHSHSNNDRNLGSDPTTSYGHPTEAIQHAFFNLRRAHTVARDKDVSERNDIRTKTRKQKVAETLLRVKDSHEVLRRRTSKHSNGYGHGHTEAASHDAFVVPSREPKNFTVGKVGHNGRMYLRPIDNLNRCPPPHPSSVKSHPHVRPNLKVDPYAGTETPRSFTSQLSVSRPELNLEENSHGNEPLSSTSTSARSSHFHYRLKKARSFNTVLEHRQSSDLARRGECRAVIDRSDDRPKSVDGFAPVPHHKLDTTRKISIDGDAVATRDDSTIRYAPLSNLDNHLASMSLPSLSLKVNASSSQLPQRPSFVESMFSSAANPCPSNRASIPVGSNSYYFEMKDPVEPSIFDSLIRDMNDPSVVRYIPGTRSISAATPARIVAEISSDSFMDYELVSDFFLTFRSYLSLSDLLSLLLARLQWAINRLQDDGRIIRIRTFAAIRHWILNYFVDDFLTNYDLRVQFCDTINAIYDDVKSRENSCVSDLKILLDLKRCWLGRCSMCWDISNLPFLYNDPDSPILPGDESPVEHVNNIGGVDGYYQDTAMQADSPVTNAVPGSFVIGGNGGGGSGGEGQRSDQHSRNGTSAPAKSFKHLSTSSNNSIQATSCSLPPRSRGRGEGHSPGFNGGRAPHPVPLMPFYNNQVSPTPKEHCPGPPSGWPVSLRHHPAFGHAHKRSGSFSDSVRDDRVPQDHQHGFIPILEVLCPPGSLIRGDLCPPPESCMPSSAALRSYMQQHDTAANISSSNRDRRDLEENSKPPSSSGGMKTFIGTIRRALLNRNNSGHGQGQNSSSSERHGSGITTNASWLPALRGKTSALPANLAFGSRLYRDRKATTESKKGLKFDLLCEQVFKQYHLAIADQQQDGSNSVDDNDITLPSKNAADFDANSPSPVTLEESNLESSVPLSPLPHPPRMYSQLTEGSESIVIVDGTGANASSPGAGAGAGPGPRNEANSSRVASWGVSSQASARTSIGRASFPLYYDTAGSVVSGSRLSQSQHSDSATQRRSHSVGRKSAFCKSASPSLRLLKYASFQSGISKQRRTLCADMTTATRSSDTNTSRNDESVVKPSGRMLRRRPGGDLRRMRDGRSVASLDISHRSSTTETTLTTQNGCSNNSSASEAAAVPNHHHRFSLLDAHSSQNIRPSFEEAIAQFAQIPDEDDGGVESTLLKLEGKWKRKQQSDEDGDGEGDYESYTSAPLLEWGLSDDSMKKPKNDNDNSNSNYNNNNFSQVAPSSSSNYCYPNANPNANPNSHPHRDPTTLPPRLSGITDRDMSEPAPSHTSFDLVQKTESLKCIPSGFTMPVSASDGPGSNAVEGCGPSGFERSSDLSVDIIDPREAMDEGQEKEEERQSITRLSLGSQFNFEIPSHPLAQPPSPPMTIPNFESRNSCATPSNPLKFRAAPPLTPGPSPQYSNSKPERDENERSRDIRNVSSNVLMRSERDQRDQQHVQQTQPDAEHVPFILSCDSHILAQQLTLVEMAALSEVDWRDLVDMKCNAGPPNTLNWVQFLCDGGERKGIELVVGRFNLMVKWVLSQVVLTREIGERARTISKFIHTAAHAKSICNYATTLQICIALSSSDCSRLHKTWALVSAEDERLFRDMEVLIRPVRNFHDLRVEMETANLQDGCVPFVGLYVHDLTYNAQKPSKVANMCGGEPLVNFERYRRAAKIIKNLLRLIDASTRYDFEPVPGIIERCLWIGSLAESEIQSRSKELI